MTQTLPSRTAPTRTRPAPPALPAIVPVEHRGHRYLIHRTNTPHARHTPMTTDAIRRSDATWCPTCWPGRTCGVCRAPSGDAGECEWCLPDGIRAEVTADRAIDHEET
jgi:hypothetical protein